MSGATIIIIIFVVIGAIIGLFASVNKDSEMNPPQGCLAGAFTGGIGGLGCIAAIFYALLPLAIAYLVISWLLNGCS